MYTLYLFCFKLLYFVRLKKTSIRLARNLERFCRSPLEDSKLYNALWEFVVYQQHDYTWFCQDGGGCYFPVLSDTDKFHQPCRARQADEDAREAELDRAEMELTCHDCWEKPAVKDRRCQTCWDNAFLCPEGCGKLDTECNGNCYLDSRCDTPHCHGPRDIEGLCRPCWDERYLCQRCGGDNRVCHEDHDEDDGDDYHLYNDPDEEECPDGCGQPAYACVCAELASLKRYNATPMEERCGPWTA
jgi:hypothetical protein